MVRFTATIKKYGSHADKSGWIYIDIGSKTASAISPGTKKSFRVKGKIDNYSIEKTSLLPVGEGSYILPLNAQMRKGIRKTVGAKVVLQLTEDKRALEIYPPLLECLRDEPLALENFNKLAPSHQRYFSKWITDAKTEPTRIKRMASTINAMLTNMSYGEMIRAERNQS